MAYKFMHFGILLSALILGGCYEPPGSESSDAGDYMRRDVWGGLSPGEYFKLFQYRTQGQPSQHQVIQSDWQKMVRLEAGDIYAKTELYLQDNGKFTLRVEEGIGDHVHGGVEIFDLLSAPVFSGDWKMSESGMELGDVATLKPFRVDDEPAVMLEFLRDFAVYRSDGYQFVLQKAWSPVSPEKAKDGIVESKYLNWLNGSWIAAKGNDAVRLSWAGPPRKFIYEEADKECTYRFVTRDSQMKSRFEEDFIIYDYSAKLVDVDLTGNGGVVCRTKIAVLKKRLQASPQSFNATFQRLNDGYGALKGKVQGKNWVLRKE